MVLEQQEWDEANEMDEDGKELGPYPEPQPSPYHANLSP
jgi:hypothetical protein